MFDILKNIRKQQLQLPGKLCQTDMHGHWLPGIDDGAATLENSLQMLGQYTELGYTSLIATPHIYKDYYPNTKDTIQAAFAVVQQKASRMFPGLHISFAAEYYLDDHFEGLMQARKLLPFLGNHVLVEQAYFAETPGINTYLFDIQIKGYTPVLAHPERYVYYHSNNKKITYMRELGTKMQINLLSLAGKYGPVIAAKAEEYLERGWVDFIGTDAHREEDLLLCRSITLSKRASAEIEKISEMQG